MSENRFGVARAITTNRDSHELLDLWSKAVKENQGRLYKRALGWFHCFPSARELAEEHVQDTLLKAWIEKETLNDWTKFRSWINTLSYNLFINKIRRWRREEKVKFKSAKPATPRFNSHPIDVAVEIHEAMSLLEEDEREVLLLRCVDQCTWEEIAGIMGRPKRSCGDLYGLSELEARARPMRCTQFKADLLPQYIDGELLTASEMNMVRRHLEGCSICRHEEQALRSILSAFSVPSEPTEVQKDFWPMLGGDMRESDPFLSLLAKSLARRQLDVANKLVIRNIYRFVDLDPADKDAPALLSYFAQWIHITGSANIECAGYSNLSLLRSTYRRFPEIRLHYDLLQCVHLQMAAGFIALHSEQYDAAIRRFLFVLGAEEDLGVALGVEDGIDLVAMASHALGQVYARKGEYFVALSYLEKAIDFALRADHQEMSAAFLASKGYLLFQLNKPTDAETCFLMSEPILRASGDYLSVGDIRSTRAKIRQREGKNHDSLQLLIGAIRDYSKCDKTHGNIARALVNVAFLKRQIALRPCVSDKEAFTLRQIALKHLARADAIYSSHNDYRGRGSTRLVRAFIRIDQYDCDGAAADAAEAHALAEENRDNVLMVRSLLVECRVENLKLELEIPSTTPHCLNVEHACDIAQRAVNLAELTQDKRLIANSYTWRGIALLNATPTAADQAQKFYKKASALLANLSFPPLERRELLHGFDRSLAQQCAFVDDLYSSKAANAARQEEVAGVDWIIDELRLLERKIQLASQAHDSSEDVNATTFRYEESSPDPLLESNSLRTDCSGGG